MVSSNTGGLSEILMSKTPQWIENQPASQFFSVSEAAIILNVSKKTVYECIRDGKLAAVQVGSGVQETRISRTNLEAFIAENTPPSSDNPET